MAIKPVATTEDELKIYEQEENLAKVYERRQDEYEKLLERLEKNKTSPYEEWVEQKLCLDICEFLLREVQFKKLI